MPFPCGHAAAEPDCPVCSHLERLAREDPAYADLLGELGWRPPPRGRASRGLAG